MKAFQNQWIIIIIILIAINLNEAFKRDQEVLYERYSQNCELNPETFHEGFSDKTETGEKNNLRKKSDPVLKMNTMQYCKYMNYPVEEHQIETQDGFILTYFRVQKKNGVIRSGLPVIFYQHGLFDSSDGALLFNDEERSLIFYFANKGFDVWLGNSRGNYYSKQHVNQTKQSQKWDFTFQDMAAYDLPAGFEYIHKNTGTNLIDYIGHSQGTLQMFIALAQSNQVIKQYLRNFFALGPVMYLTNINVKGAQELAHKVKKLSILTKRFGIRVLLPHWWVWSRFAGKFCQKVQGPCQAVISSQADMDLSYDNMDRLDIIASHFPMGSSVKNMIHFAQYVDSGEFKAYDYFSEQANMENYGTPTPPQFDIKNIKDVKIHLYAGLTDRLATIEDSRKIYSNLKTITNITMNEYGCGHGSFLFGKDMSYLDDIYIQIIE